MPSGLQPDLVDLLSTLACFFRVDSRIRTGDHMDHNHALYLLSYTHHAGEDANLPLVLLFLCRPPVARPWAIRDSNPGPPRCERGALAAELTALARIPELHLKPRQLRNPITQQPDLLFQGAAFTPVPERGTMRDVFHARLPHPPHDRRVQPAMLTYCPGGHRVPELSYHFAVSSRPSHISSRTFSGMSHPRFRSLRTEARTAPEPFPRNVA